MLANQTPKGKAVIDQSEAILNRLASDDTQYIHHHPDSVSPIDGYISHKGYIVSCFQMKFRNASFQNDHILISGKRYDDYLITAETIEKGIQIANTLTIPFILIVHFENNDTTVFFKIHCPKTNTTLPYTKQQTTTQATINGGIAHRINAFIPIHYAKKLTKF